jgi:hypothetical protein
MDGFDVGTGHDHNGQRNCVEWIVLGYCGVGGFIPAGSNRNLTGWKHMGTAIQPPYVDRIWHCG